MMKFALGRYDKPQISLFSLEKESRLTLSETEAVIVSALDCHIHAIPTKLRADQQIRSFCDHYIKTIHPGPYSSLETDYLLTGKGKNRTILLVIMEREILEAYLALDRPLYFFFQMEIPGISPGSFRFTAEGFSEHYLYEDQRLKSVDVARDPRENMPALPRKGAGCKVNRSGKKRLFREEKRAGALSALLPAALALMLLFLIYQNVLSLTEYNRQKKAIARKQEVLQEMVRRGQTPETPGEEEEILRLGDLIYRSVPRNHYGLFSRMSGSLRSRVTVKSLKVTGEAITLNGKTRSALQLVEDLNKTEMFTELTPSRIYPTEDGQEEFSLTGVLREDLR